MKFHFLIVEHNSRELLDDFIKSIIVNIDEINITIIDNNSDYDVSQYFSNRINIVKLQENIGYGAAINKIALNLEDEFLVICNSDLVFLEDTFEKIKEFIDIHPEIYFFGGQQEYPNGEWQYSYGFLPSFKEVFLNIFYINQIIRYFKIKNYKRNSQITIEEVDYIDGAFMIIKSELFRKLNGFDEDFYFYSEDADLCYRANKLNYKTYYTNYFHLIHHRGGSSEKNLLNEKKAELFANGINTFLRKHRSKIYSYIYKKLYKFSLNLSIFINKFLYILRNDENKITKINNFKLIGKYL